MLGFFFAVRNKIFLAGGRPPAKKIFSTKKFLASFRLHYIKIDLIFMDFGIYAVKHVFYKDVISLKQSR